MLEARHLVKNYGARRALNDVSFEIRRGEVLGYLGPNGSGKSTTVRLIAGLMEPSEGTVLLDGEDIRKNLVAYKRRIGYLPEEPNLYPYLSASEFLTLVAGLRDLDERLAQKKIEELLRLFDLYDMRHAPVAEYSKGMRQKVLFSATLLHDPEVLIVDEPLSGLDVTSASVIRHLVRTLAERGKIVFYSSHVLEIVEKLCTRIVILYAGQVAAYDSVENLRKLAALPSLGQVFSKLVEDRDPASTAQEIADVMALR